LNAQMTAQMKNFDKGRWASVLLLAPGMNIIILLKLTSSSLFFLFYHL